MSVTINTNVTSMVVQRKLGKAQDALSKSMERLASGLRINRAKDDAAGMAVSKLMDKQISGLMQGVRNANDGISVIQVTESTLEEIGNNLQRMRELAAQSANGSYDSQNRSAMQLEFSALRAEIDRVADTAEFNGYKIADGSNSSMVIQVGANNTANDRISIKMTSAKASALGISAGVTLSSSSSAQSALDSIDSAINTLSAARAKLGADESRLSTAIESNLNTAENLMAANSRIKDVDFAEEVSTMATNSVLSQAGTAMLSQANTLPQVALSLLQ